MTQSPGILFIGPPFGNVLRLPGTVAVQGSFTAAARPGLWRQILRTVRYSRPDGGWLNRVGLRNPGIECGLARWRSGRVTSIAVTCVADVEFFLRRIPAAHIDLEINVSCPNIAGEAVPPAELARLLSPARRWCIVKLPPRAGGAQVAALYREGFRQFHFSNTLPTARGGLSGPALRPHVRAQIRETRARHPGAEIIAGGGIRSVADMDDYRAAGADHFSVSTLCFSPPRLFWLYVAATVSGRRRPP